MGAPKMRKYSPITIYKYLDLPSTQIIQTHTTQKRNTTTPTPPALPTQPKHRHISHTPPVPSGLVNPKPNLLTYSHHTCHSPEPNTYHTLHLQFSPHPPYSSIARLIHYTQHLNHVYHLYTHTPHSLQPHFPRPHHQHFHHPRTLSAYSHHTKTTVHAAQRNHQTHNTWYQDNLTNRPRTTT